MRLEEFIKEQIETDPEFAKEYYKEDLGHDIAMQIFEARIKIGMTQKQLAEKIGTKQSSIARIENYEHLPSLRFLKKIADAFETKLIAPRFEFLGEPKEKIQVKNRADKRVNHIKQKSSRLKKQITNINTPRKLKQEIVYEMQTNQR